MAIIFGVCKVQTLSLFVCFLNKMNKDIYYSFQTIKTNGKSKKNKAFCCCTLLQFSKEKISNGPIGLGRVVGPRSQMLGFRSFSSPLRTALYIDTDKPKARADCFLFIYINSQIYVELNRQKPLYTLKFAA